MTSAGSIRIVVADRYRIFREGLVLLLNHHRGISVVGECGGAQELLDLIVRLRPDLTILGLRLSRLNGFRTVSEILKAQPAARILVLSELDAEDEIDIARQAGVSGFLPKEADGSELLSAIQNIYAGHRYFPPYAQGVVRSPTKAR